MWHAFWQQWSICCTTFNAGKVAGEGRRGAALAGGQGSSSLPGVLQHSCRRAQPCYHLPGYTFCLSFMHCPCCSHNQCCFQSQSLHAACMSIRQIACALTGCVCYDYFLALLWGVEWRQWGGDLGCEGRPGCCIWTSHITALKKLPGCPSMGSLQQFCLSYFSCCHAYLQRRLCPQQYAKPLPAGAAASGMCESKYTWHNAFHAQ